MISIQDLIQKGAELISFLPPMDMSCEAYQKLFAVVRLLLVIVCYISPRIVIAKPVVCDHINAVGGVLKVALTNELLQSASFSRRRYEQH